MVNLKPLRRDCGLSQYELARAAGLHRWKISHAELGIYEFTDAERKRVSKILLTAAREKNARLIRQLAPRAAVLASSSR